MAEISYRRHRFPPEVIQHGFESVGVGRFGEFKAIWI